MTYDTIRRIVASWNAAKRDVAAKSTTSVVPFTTLHNEQTRKLLAEIGNEHSAEWWEGLAELATNASHIIRSRNVSPGVRILDPEDVRQRGVVNDRLT